MKIFSKYGFVSNQSAAIYRQTHHPKNELIAMHRKYFTTQQSRNEIKIHQNVSDPYYKFEQSAVRRYRYDFVINSVEIYAIPFRGGVDSVWGASDVSRNP